MRAANTPTPDGSARTAVRDPSPPARRGTWLIAIAASICCAAIFAWLLERSLFQAHAQTFDAMIYGRSLWGIAHGESSNSVLGVHWLTVHANWVLIALAPLTAWFEPVRILLVAQVLALAFTLGQVSVAAARGHSRPALVAALVVVALAWGTPLVGNPFLFDVRPDLIGVPLCVAGLLRIHARRHVDVAAVAWLFAALLVREEYSMVIAPALVCLPLERGAGLGVRARWTLAIAACAYTLAYDVVGRQLLGGSEAVSRVADVATSIVSLPTAESWKFKPEIIAIALTAVGGLALLGWRWSVPAWPGLLFVLAINRLPELTLNAHYAEFAAAGLCVAAVAGAQRLRTFTRERRRLAWLAVVVSSLGAGLLSSAAPAGRRFRASVFDLERTPAKVSRFDHTPTYLAARALLERVPPNAGLVVPLGIGAGFVDRALVWEGHRLRRALGGAEPIPPEITYVAVLADEWTDTGKTLVQQHGFRLFDVADDWLAILARADVDASALQRMSSAAPTTSRALARWSSAGLALTEIGRTETGELFAVLVREEFADPSDAARPFVLMLDGLSKPIELTALGGILNPRDVPVGRAVRFTGPRTAGQLELFARLARRDDAGRWIVLDPPASERVRLP